MRILTVVVVAALGVNSASAENRAEADEQARRGVALYNLGKFEEAIVAFEQAYTLFPSDALLFNLAQAHRQLDHCALALQYYRRFMDGAPAPALVAQVEKLLPKLEAACRTKDERPNGPVIDPAVVVKPAQPDAEVPDPGEPSPPEDSIDEEPAMEPRFYATAGLTAGSVIAGGTAPTAGVKGTLSSPLAFLRGGELGAAIGVGRMWRGDADHDATLASVAATIRFHSELDWGRLTIGGEVGGAYFSSLDTSSGVVPGLSRAGVWVPHARVELGGEHAVGSSLALRVALALGACPRVGPMLSAVGQLDFLLGLRYSR